ncbi:MAG: dodecin family protein [Alphaproteobacteria bacterium]|jgi:dodecin|nr:dodecin family protein [Alphaproteobacteria bacterium]
MAVAKVIEVTGGSSKGLEDAIIQGVSRAADSLDQVEGAWIQDIKLQIKNGKIAEWRVNMKVTFILK